MLLRCWWCGVVWGGVGWDVYVPCTSYISCCYAVEISGIVATSHVVTLLMVWGLKDLQDWKNLARWQRLASEKYKNFGFFFVWGQKLNASTTVNSWKRLQSHANTNGNASHVKMRMSQNPGRVAKLKTELLEKKVKLRGVIAGGVSLFRARCAWMFLDGVW